jgi:peptidyl-prolyl cis-trans isomerase A (cyclophilin A)
MKLVRILSAVIVLSAAQASAQAPAAQGKPAETKAAPPAAAATEKAPAGTKWTAKAAEGKDLYATFKTSEGDIVVKLFSKDAPKTVQNFVGLATGEKEWTHPGTHAKAKTPLYNGTIFHRVIPDFMVQAGDPLGTGTGDPGYRFGDEFQSGRKFDKVGLLAMANAGPGTNGSQFFITTSMPGYLNNKHTIFGEVISGYENVVKISQVPRNAMDRPNKDVKIEKIELSDKAPGKVSAKATDAKK